MKKFKLKEKVLIRDLELKGTVTALHESVYGFQYEVAYFHNGILYSKYMYSEYLEKINN